MLKTNQLGGFSASARKRIIEIASDVASPNIRSILETQGVDVTKDITLELRILSRVTVGSLSTASPALDLSFMTSRSVISLVILTDAHVVGRGGNGGTGSPSSGTPGYPGDAGGPAIKLSCKTKITNRGKIGGGGGGGGGAADNHHGSAYGGGGGGGAGYPGGSGGGARGPAQGGVQGSVETGGGGGWGDAYGGTGGDLGKPGAVGGSASSYGGAGGAAGAAIIGGTWVTFKERGTILGNII